jgi:hypothetical protein
VYPSHSGGLIKPRAHLPAAERDARSRLAKLLHEKQIVAGSIVNTQQTCGNPNCRCKKGEKHPATYLALKYKGKRRMFSVCAQRRKQICQAVDNYKEMQRLVDIVSRYCCDTLLEKGK